jgi:hypothetical protein
MSAGIKANSDGSAAIQVGGSDYITISAAGAVAIPGTLTVGGFPAGGNYALQNYVAPGTWTKPAGLKAIKVTVVGAGGNGGAANGVGAPTRFAVGGGGGAGGAAIEYIPAPSIPGPVAVTAGPGTNSFGAFCSATAGSAGSTASNTVNVGIVAAGGAGGAGSGGNINFPGGAGGVGTGALNTNMAVSGIGGSSILGGTALSVATNTTPGSAGGAGGNYGGGGGGAAAYSPGGNFSGGAGAPGIVIVEEFY